MGSEMCIRDSKWSALDNRMLRCTVGNEVRDWKAALACFFEHWNGENGMK